MKQSLVYKRAQSMVLQDKFNYRKTDFFDELNKLVAQYMEYDSLTVDIGQGSNNNMLITVSVKKIKPTSRLS